MTERVIIKGKIGGWRPNSGRKPGFTGYWKGKPRPGAKFEHLAKYHVFGTENYFSKINYPGENHPRWAGGSWLYWRKFVLARDKFTCQSCGLQDPEVMQVDHIIAKMKLRRQGKVIRHDPNNLQMLCANCHMKKTAKDKRGGAKSKSYYSI